MTDDLALLDRLFAAIETGDTATVAELYADDIVVWNNVADEDTTKADNLKLLGWFHRKVDGLRYEIVERIPFDGGVVQRHLTHGRANGEDFAFPCCIVFRIADGKITSLHEYLDSAGVAPAFA